MVNKIKTTHLSVTEHGTKAKHCKIGRREREKNVPFRLVQLAQNINIQNKRQGKYQEQKKLTPPLTDIKNVPKYTHSSEEVRVNP